MNDTDKGILEGYQIMLSAGRELTAYEQAEYQRLLGDAYEDEQNKP
jgi:hypothetical protein